MMKKLLALLLVLAMVCSMAFVFTACDDGNDDVGGGSGSVEGGDEGGSGNAGDAGASDEDFNHDFKDSGVSVANPESDAANGANDADDYVHNK